MQKDIIIKGAREHNLKNISVTIPRNSLTVITGLSGSGKSSLAFDTLYAEGQRRYVESLSSYARQFLGLMNKPDVDSIEGLSPAISIEQKSTSKNPRSTVGTVTEIYDYLRLLYARVGTPHCPKCGKQISAQTAEMIVKNIFSQNKEGAKLMILAPIIRGKKGTYEKLFIDLKKEGFSKVRVNGEVKNVDDPIKLDRYKMHTIEIVIDRIALKLQDKSRLNDAIEQSLKRAHGLVNIWNEQGEKTYSAHLACPDCGIDFPELQPRSFSFNSPFGACVSCHGLGYKQEFDVDLLFPDKHLSLADGALHPWRTRMDGWRGQTLRSVAKYLSVDFRTPIKSYTKKQWDALLLGIEHGVEYVWKSKQSDAEFRHTGKWEGIIPKFTRFHQETESDKIREEFEKYMRMTPCGACREQRLKPEVLAVTIEGINIFNIGEKDITHLVTFFSQLQLDKKKQEIAKQVFKELRSRLGFLEDVGLGYLTLNRRANTLSGGEAQRINLATQIGSNLTGVMYILDEPSIGLHQRDNQKLIATLTKLRDLGNTVIVVEHDEETIRSADYVLDIGPGAGVHGGSVVFSGTPKQLEKNTKSITGQYLNGKKEITIPSKRRQPLHILKVVGATEHNLKNITAQIPLGVLTCVTGVSGSGKSTLINDILYNALADIFNGKGHHPGKHKEVTGVEHIDKVIIIDQSPIGRTPRSNPATYTKLFDEVRNLFAATQESKIRGYGPGRFSFNVADGRCGTCEGDGMIKIEMHFLPDVYVECEECKGKRYNSETLEVTYKDKTIADILYMSIEEALAFFEHYPPIERKLRTLVDVGLGYMKLGQSATTLSGGEAQRVKLTSELAKKGTGRTLYIMDEPTTGLHFDDIHKLLGVMNRLVEKGNTVLVIEHNLDVIKSADYVIDMGPEGGEKGGEIIAQGTPEEVAKNNKSYTGQFLKKLLKKD